MPEQVEFKASDELIDEFNKLIDDLAAVGVLHMRDLDKPTSDPNVGTKRILWPVIRLGNTGFAFQDRIYSLFRKCTKQAIEERMAKDE